LLDYSFPCKIFRGRLLCVHLLLAQPLKILHRARFRLVLLCRECLSVT
jgi:hypothetical protein